MDAFDIPSVVLDRPLFKDGGTDISRDNPDAWKIGSNIPVSKK